MIQITYYMHGEQYSELFTHEEAREALRVYGWPNVDKMDNKQVAQLLKEAYNP